MTIHRAFFSVLCGFVIMTATARGQSTAPSTQPVAEVLSAAREGDFAKARDHATLGDDDAESFRALTSLLRSYDRVKQACIARFPADATRANVQPSHSEKSDSIQIQLDDVLSLRFKMSETSGARKVAGMPALEHQTSTSCTLTYQIRTSKPSPQLAKQMIESLKLRLDPDGVHHLAFRPRNDMAIEVQIPLPELSPAEIQKHRTLNEARERLERTNANLPEVITAVEELSGAARERRLDELAGASSLRHGQFARLAATADQIKAAHEARDPVAQATAENQYDDLKSEILWSNVTPQNVQEIAELDRDRREAQLDQLKKRFAGWNERLEAIDALFDQYTAADRTRDPDDDIADVKRLLHGLGVLSFHVIAAPSARGEFRPPADGDQYAAMVSRLENDGPVSRPGDATKWFELDEPMKWFRTENHKDKTYILAYIAPLVGEHGAAKPLAMSSDPRHVWTLKSAHAVMQEGRRIVGFEFDENASADFGELTDANIGNQLGIMLDDKLISAPRIQSKISGAGIIDGGGAVGFSRAEQRYLVAVLNAGALPAPLSDEPIAQTTQTRADVCTGKDFSAACMAVSKALDDVAAQMTAGKFPNASATRDAASIAAEDAFLARAHRE